MKLNNRGMTLIELIVSFAILGVMSVSVFGIILTSTKTYTKMTSSVKLQYEAQLAMANIERHVQNCNYAISWGKADAASEDDKNELFIVNEDAEGKRTLKLLYLKTITDELFYGIDDLVGDFEKNENIQANPTFYLLAEHVDDIKVKLITATGADGLERVKQIQVTLIMSQNNIKYKSEKTIALRNKPLATYQWNLTHGGGGTGQVGNATPTPTPTPTPVENPDVGA